MVDTRCESYENLRLLDEFIVKDLRVLRLPRSFPLTEDGKQYFHHKPLKNKNVHLHYVHNSNSYLYILTLLIKFQMILQGLSNAPVAIEL